jgi:hypothetical protein
MTPAPAPLESPRRLLLVEGKDDSAFVQSLCRAHRLPQVFRVQETGGIHELLQTAPVAIRAGLECVGVVLDANGDARARWASVRQLLHDEEYREIPDHPDAGGVVLAGPGTRPRVGVWIMPDNASAGMLEDFAASLVASSDFLWTHAEQAIDAIPAEHRRFADVHRPKALIHTWLAWQEGPGSPMGQAITKGDLDANAPPAQRFVAWLRRLMVDDPPAEESSSGR